MAWCLTKQAEERLLEELRKDGDPQKMVDRGTEGRLKWFTERLGEETGTQLATFFEKKMLLKSQVQGFKSFIKGMGGSKQIKNDFISKVERLEKALSKSEIEQWLGNYIKDRLKLSPLTEEQFKTITDMTDKVADFKTKANKEGVFPTEEDRWNYGDAAVRLKYYVDDLKMATKQVSFKEHPDIKIRDSILGIPGFMKSSKASFDNSFWGRQGVGILYTDPDIWVKDFLKSWVDIKRQVTSAGFNPLQKRFWGAGDDAVMQALLTEVYSRPNAVNGKYDAGNFGLDVFSEEAYPSSAPEKIPLLGRLFKASEVAYNGGAIRLRADLADRLIGMAEGIGVNMMDRKEAQPVGELVSSFTGRGPNYIGATGKFESFINAGFFSVRLFFSDLYKLLTPIKYATNKYTSFGGFANKGEEFTQKEAAKRMLRVWLTLAAINLIAGIIDKNSVDPDPRSTNFGKIKIFGHWTAPIGGLTSLVTLGARLTPTWHNGKLGFWSKSSTGAWTKLSTGKFGVKTALDMLYDYGEGKLSPSATIPRDIWNGSDFQGRPNTVANLMINSTVPLTPQNFLELKDDPASSFVLGSTIIDSIGLTTSTYRYSPDWSVRTSEELQQFKDKKGDAVFRKANNDYNRVYAEWHDRFLLTPEYNSMSDENKDTLITKAKSDIQAQILKEYGFYYIKPLPTDKEREEKKIIEKLRP